MTQKQIKIIKAQDTIKPDKDYQNLLQELKSLMLKGQYEAYKAVDNIKVQTYWQMGERIVREELKYKDRADYGDFIITNLVKDLQIKRQELYKIIKFYRLYENVGSVTRQLSWTHYYYLIDINDNIKRAFYQNKSVINSWSVRELRKQIKNNLYKNTPKKEIEETFKTKLPSVVENQEVFKNDYDLKFIELPPEKSEKELEKKIMANFEMVLKEFGEDFSFVGRQVPIKIGNETHYIDLVLYHKGIPCNVLVELKIGKFDSRDVGQMNKYIAYYRRNKQYEHEKDTIGLIICQDTNKEEVVYALDGLEQKIFVAQYKVKLPSEDKIKKAIKANK